MVRASDRLDAALVRARRVFEVPPLVADNGERVESSTLLILAALDNLGQGATTGDIADWLDVAHSTASRLVSRAVDAAAITREPSASDRREHVLRATDAGARLAERAATYRAARLAQLTQDWTPAEIETFAELMERLAQTVRAER